MYVYKKQINAYVSVHERQHSGITGIHSVARSRDLYISLGVKRLRTTAHSFDWSTRCKQTTVIKGDVTCH